jgi:hypothetical protein
MNFKPYFTESLSEGEYKFHINRYVLEEDQGYTLWYLTINDEPCEYIQYNKDKSKSFFHVYPQFVFDWTEDEGYKLEDLMNQLDQYIKQWKIKHLLSPETKKSFDDLINTIL